MANQTQYVKHIELFVDSSSSPTQQDASVDAIAGLLKNDVLSIETLVREMEMYLTTTDSIIRARGILLLAELLVRLPSKRLDDTTIRSLTGFFTERLADWKALRGALVGCLALMRRKSNVGMVTGSEATAVAKSYLSNLQVQSLGQHDRKLCFELVECLLDCHPNAVIGLGDDLIYGICEAIDEEKDPHCLILTFHIVELLARLFSDPYGPIATFAGDLFDILGCYFPIHFTHPKCEDIGVKREELSRVLMLAFASTPLFEPSAVPLLLEKLSSSLPSAKVDSLKYLSYCAEQYGSERMGKHAAAIWSSLKDAIFTSPPIVSLEPEIQDVMGFQETEVAKEAFLLLRRVILQNDNLYLNMIVGDEDLNTTINSITCYKCYDDMTLQNKQKLHAVGRILSVTANASTVFCNKLFGSFFLRLMDTLGLLAKSSLGDSHFNEDYVPSEKLCFGAVYLCVELLSACRCLVVGSEEVTTLTVSADESWGCMLQSFCSLLVRTFNSILVTSDYKIFGKAFIHLGVIGLQILATFPGSFLPVPKSTFEDILTKLISIIIMDFKNTYLWKLSLKALVEIGSFIHQHQESEKAQSFNHIVLEKIISLMSHDDLSMPLSLKLEIFSEIGQTGMNFMLRLVHGLEKAIFANLFEVYVHGNSKSAEFAVLLLECYCNKVLPWFQKTGGLEDVAFSFAVNIWDQIKNSMTYSFAISEKELLNATMMVMKLSVASCSEGRQRTIIQKALDVLSSSTSSLLKASMSTTASVELEGLLLTQNLDSFAYRDEWILSLFASVIITLRPETHIPNVKIILHVFVTSFLYGHVPSAQALGSLVNKLSPKTSTMETSDGCSLEEAMDIVFNGITWSAHENRSFRRCPGLGAESEIGLSSLRHSNVKGRPIHIHAIIGLAWIGKGLLMRGHEKVRDMTMIFLSCLLLNHDTAASPFKWYPLKDCREEDALPLMKSASDAFHILMSDSEACLNKRFHAIIRPLYKQRYFSTVMPILLSSVPKSGSSNIRSMLYRAIAHVISDTPLIAILSEAQKLVPVLLDILSLLSEDIMDRDIVFNVLLVLSGILTDDKGQEVAGEHVHSIINRLSGLISYPHMMLVRETAIQCLVALSLMPHTKIYPMRKQVLRAMSKALDDPKRNVRLEAVRCRQAWASIASRSIHF